MTVDIAPFVFQTRFGKQEAGAKVREVEKAVVMGGEDAVAQGLNKQARVLLVEDDNALRRMLAVTLRRAGYQVIAAADGVEAMTVALSSPVDIVVTDAMMPNLPGQEFCLLL